jgi:hypothetical protein
MELAATQGVDHLATEVDKRLTSLETLGSKVSWRQRPTFLRDLDALRELIAERMSGLDQGAALERMWRFVNVARRVGARVRDKHGEVDALFDRAVQDLGGLVRRAGDQRTSVALIHAIEQNPRAWGGWVSEVLQDAPEGLAAATLGAICELRLPNQLELVRELADTAGDVDAYRDTYLGDRLHEPDAAAEVANRLMTVGRVPEAGEILKTAVPTMVEPDDPRKAAGRLDFGWETSWIDYLERSGATDAAQAARWRSFEATLSVERVRAFTQRLAEFDDVEAEGRAFAFAANHTDFQDGLAFLMDWPAVAEAGRMIEQRPDDIRVTLAQADLWAPRLRRVKPRAAYLLLRKAAADAFRRREFATCDRLTQEAEAIALPDPD